MTLIKMEETVGRYKIESVAGKGGMATVYVAYDPLFERRVAIKLLPSEVLSQPTLRQRFEREAKIVAALDHPYLVPVYDIGKENNVPYLVMRYMRGGSLVEQLDEGALSVDKAVEIILRLADGLNAIHEKNIIHRDLKPSNILFDQWGSPFISDFGMARPMQVDAMITSLGSTVGTPAYMSPEQIQGESDIDCRSDIYALGILLYEMLSGEHPYETDSLVGVIVQHITEPPPRLLDKNPALSSGFEDVILKAMAKNPKDRYPTALAMAAAVKAAQVQERGRQTVVSQMIASPIIEEKRVKTAVSKTTANKTKRSYWIFASGMILIVLFAFFFFGGKDMFIASRASETPTAVLQDTLRTTVLPTTPDPIVGETAVSPTKLATTAPLSATSPADTVASITPPPATDNEMRAIEPSSLFAEPSTSSNEVAIVAVGERVLPLARTDNSRWLYVRTEQFVQGYIFVTRVEWAGDIEDLPLQSPTVLPTPAADCTGSCPLLELDAYPLENGRCADGLYYVTIYMEGHGGNSVYRYFWENKQIVDETSDSFIFEMPVPEGQIILGTASVRSGDEQLAKRPLQISGNSCP